MRGKFLFRQAVIAVGEMPTETVTTVYRTATSHDHKYATIIFMQQAPTGGIVFAQWIQYKPRGR